MFVMPNSLKLVSGGTHKTGPIEMDNLYLYSFLAEWRGEMTGNYELKDRGLSSKQKFLHL